MSFCRERCRMSSRKKWPIRERMTETPCFIRKHLAPSTSLVMEAVADGPLHRTVVRHPARLRWRWAGGMERFGQAPARRDRPPGHHRGVAWHRLARTRGVGGRSLLFMLGRSWDSASTTRLWHEATPFLVFCSLADRTDLSRTCSETAPPVRLMTDAASQCLALVSCNPCCYRHTVHTLGAELWDGKHGARSTQCREHVITTVSWETRMRPLPLAQGLLPNQQPPPLSVSFHSPARERHRPLIHRRRTRAPAHPRTLPFSPWPRHNPIFSKHQPM